MSNTPDKNERFNDADLAALFASDCNEPPKELDNLVLENAQLSQNDTIGQHQETFGQKYAPLFGTAAVLMIGIALTPMTMQSPESQLDNGYAPAVSMTPVAPNENLADAVSTRRSDTTSATALAATVEADKPLSKQVRQVVEPEPAEVAVSASAAKTATEETRDVSIAQLAEKAQLVAPQREELAESEAQDADASLVTQQPTTTRARSNSYSSDQDILPVPPAELNDEAYAEAKKSLRMQSGALQGNTQSQVPVFKASPSTQNGFAAAAPSEKDIALAPEPIGNTHQSNETKKNKLSEQAKMNKYRNSALLWIIEIKRLYKENMIKQAHEELALFRKKYQNHSNERLLPEPLQSIELD